MVLLAGLWEGDAAAGTHRRGHLAASQFDHREPDRSSTAPFVLVVI